MKKGYYKFMAAAAVCAVLAATVWVSDGIGERSDSDLQVKDNYVGGENSDNLGNSVLSELDRMFTLKVQAAELEVGNPVSLITNDNRQSFVLGATENNEIKEIGYCISAPFTCEGEDIETVTYSINNGAFQIVQPENESERIIVGGQLYEGEIHTGLIGGDYDEKNGGLPSRPYETVLYKSITLNYERQSDEYTWINICNSRPYGEEIFNLIWGEKTTLEDYSNAINKLLDHTIITCTVHYADGTEQSVDIQVESRVMTEVVENGEMGKSIVITYELQN